MEKSMKNLHCIDYSAVLSDLKHKRLELNKAITQLDKTITQLEGAMSFGILQHHDAAKPNDHRIVKKIDISGLSVYEGAMQLLKEKGTPMKTDDIVNAIIASGKKFKAEKPRVSITTTLYKPNKNSEIIKVGESEWGLSEWGLSSISDVSELPL